jgi:cullin 3
MKRINDAFDEFLNKDNKSALYLANYVDDLFKNGLRGKSQLESEIQTDQVILVFQHLRDKDLFENYYRQHFAKRLLGGLSVSDEIEESMIKKMKNECGYQFVSKLYGMIHDINNSKGTLEEFKASSSYSQLSLELKVDVLTIGYWQTNQLPDCSLPAEINKCCELFTNFFLNRHQGQKLLWQSYLGNADIKAQFPSGRKDLNVSTYQMCILMLFNNADQLTINQIQDATNIPEHELKRHILSLSTPKLKILNRISKSKVNKYIFIKYNLFDMYIT